MRAIVLISILLAFTANAKPIPLERNQYFVGGIIGTMTGFGLGQAIHGRYKKTGWIFTLGEGAPFLAVLSGSAWFKNPRHNQNLSSLMLNVMAISGLCYVGFRVWDLVDLWAGAYPISPQQAGLDVGPDPYKAQAVLMSHQSGFILDVINFSF
jgi:hypothetical protein